MTYQILMIEDDEQICEVVKDYFTRESENEIVVRTAQNGQDGLDLFETERVDLVLLDIMLPGGSGLTLLKELRALRKKDSIIIISAKDSIEDKVTGLDLGADDYLTKPFHLAELNARIKSVIRRKQQDGELQLSLANLTIYPDKHSVYINGKEIVLNRKEFDLLYYFISNPNRLISKATLAESVWGDYIDQADNFDFIYSQVKNLRKKLKAAGAIPEIKAVYGFGYKMTDEE